MKLSFIHTLKLKKTTLNMTQLIRIGCLCKKTLDFSLGALTDLVNNIKKSLYMYLYCILIDAGSYASIRYFMNLKKKK